MNTIQVHSGDWRLTLAVGGDLSFLPSELSWLNLPCSTEFQVCVFQEGKADVILALLN